MAMYKNLIHVKMTSTVGSGIELRCWHWLRVVPDIHSIHDKKNCEWLFLDGTVIRGAVCLEKEKNK